MGRLEQNNKKIEGAFTRALASMNDSIRNGMEYLLAYGMESCLANHDIRHQHHLEIGDSYGWILFKDGNEVSREVAEGTLPGANIEAAFEVVKSKAPSGGWCGFVVAGMKPVTYFKLEYEFIPMRKAIGELKGLDFNAIFKKNK